VGTHSYIKAEICEQKILDVDICGHTILGIATIQNIYLVEGILGTLEKMATLRANTATLYSGGGKRFTNGCHVRGIVHLLSVVIEAD
jgi:hypothetical protein